MEQLISVNAGDLVATAGAGVTLAALDAELARHGAWLALDPSGGSDLTLGAALAAGGGGPLSAGFGLPRDQVLGLSFVTRSGTAARTGGRVVKNVAGFDLAKLLIGSRGLFGDITEAHVRLRMRPLADRTVTLADDGAAPAMMTRALMMGGVNPVCFEVFDAQLAAALGLTPKWTLALRAMGSGSAIDEELAACERTAGLPAAPGETSLWHRWRTVTGAWPVLIRIGADPDTWSDAALLAARHVSCAGISVTVPRGTVRAGAAALPPLDSLRREAAARGWPVTVERGSNDPWGELPDSIGRLTRRLAESWAAAGAA